LGAAHSRARERNRTFDLLLRRQTLYPLSYAGKTYCLCDFISAGESVP